VNGFTAAGLKPDEFFNDIFVFLFFFFLIFFFVLPSPSSTFSLHYFVEKVYGECFLEKLSGRAGGWMGKILGYFWNLNFMWQ
jgi:hypothetical protein